jgi:hypothetical protein
LLLPTPAARAQHGNEITASYQVTDSVARASQLRVTVRFRLSNHAGQGLSVTNVSLRCMFPCSASAEELAPLLLRAHDSSDFTRTFTVSPQEFQQWQKGARPRLLLRVLTDDGKVVTRTIAPSAALAPRKGPE